VLHHHHSGEDAGLWPLLMERSDEAGRATLEAMEAEHSEIDPLLRSCAEGFARLAEADDDDARAALAVRLVATKERLAHHLQHEETEAIALVQEHLTEEDWLALEQEHFRAGLSPKQMFRLVSWAAYGIPDEVRREVLAKTGLLFVVLWRLGRRGFARTERRAFRYC
jgi:hemerythrin-like domain-containing protein